MLHKETVSPVLWNTLEVLCSIPALDSFRLVGGTAIALHLGHRKSVDIDFFSNEKTDKQEIRRLLTKKFPGTEMFVTEHSLAGEIDNVRVELYDDWSIPFRKPAVAEGTARLAALEDLAAFKLSAITARREKKDYIDLFYIFQSLNGLQTLKEFKNYEPLLAIKSVLFALDEVITARENKSPMPNMLKPANWNEIANALTQVAKDYLKAVEQQKRN
jgi:predicted nucleotidyltransferase component of viral defense system